MHTIVADRVESLGTFFGGSVVVLNHIEELLAFQALAWSADNLLDVRVYVERREVQAELIENFWSDWVENETAFNLRLATLVAQDEDSEAPLDRFRIGLALVHEIWRLAPDAKDLSLAIAVADNGENGKLEVELSNPALLFHEGSFAVSLPEVSLQVRTMLALGPFAIAFFRKGGAFPAATAAELREDFRRKKEEALPDSHPELRLARLDHMREADFDSTRGVLVFLHGLLSTDLGPFDGFIRAWYERHARATRPTAWPTTRERWSKWCQPRSSGKTGTRVQPDDYNGAVRAAAQEYSLVGWPHDTLTGIADNAYDLSNLIHNRVGCDVPLLFVCHSRGGLLARQATMELLGIDNRYRTSIRGCLTFGTPHEGAELADLSSPRYLGAFVAILSALKVRSMWTLTEILTYYQVKEVIQGIEDLKEASSPGFLQDLRAQELVDSPHQSRRWLPIFAVGGKYKGKKTVQSYAARRCFGLDAEHDLVVNLASSLPESIPVGTGVSCDHNSYCEEPVTGTDGFLAALQFAREKLDLEQAVFEHLARDRTD